MVLSIVSSILSLAIEKDDKNKETIIQSEKTIIATDKDNKEVTVDWTKVNAWKDPNEYQYKRADEYPSIVDQLDEIYHNGIDGWKTKIKAIKDKYPKG